MRTYIIIIHYTHTHMHTSYNILTTSTCPHPAATYNGQSDTSFYKIDNNQSLFDIQRNF